MNGLFDLEILAADRIFYQGKCRSLTVPSTDGSYGILANHENAMIAVAIGIASYTTENGEHFEAVFSSGICIVENNRVTVLVETAERPEEIDRHHAEQDAADAEEALRNRKNISDIKRAKAKMARAAQRLRAKDRTEID